MTEQLIFKLTAFARNRGDKKLKREIHQLIHRRKKMLNYTRMNDYNNYRWVLAEYNMPEEVPFNAHHKDFHNMYRNHGLLGLNRHKVFHIRRNV
jgi:hypothetical protein